MPATLSARSGSPGWKAGAVGELHAGQATHRLRLHCDTAVHGRTEPDRTVLSQPLLCDGHGRVQKDSPPVQEDDTICMLEDPTRAMVGDQHGDAEPSHVFQERAGGNRIELRGRLVEQQQLRT